MAIPVDIERFVSSGRCHFANTGAKRVCAPPRLLDLITTEASNSFQVPDMEVILARLAVPVDVPGWNRDVQRDTLREMQCFREIPHSGTVLTQPLTSDVVCQHDSCQGQADESRKDDVVHVTVSRNSNLNNVGKT